MLDINKYIARSVIRHLNGDFEEFERLRGIALEIYSEEQYQKRCICSIGEVIPGPVKRKLYKIARGKRVC